MTGLVYDWSTDGKREFAEIYWRGVSIGCLHELVHGWAVVTSRGFRLYRSEYEARAHVAESFSRREERMAA